MSTTEPTLTACDAIALLEEPNLSAARRMPAILKALQSDPEVTQEACLDRGIFTDALVAALVRSTGWEGYADDLFRSL